MLIAYKLSKHCHLNELFSVHPSYLDMKLLPYINHINLQTQGSTPHTNCITSPKLIEIIKTKHKYWTKYWMVGWYW
jgi:hypothetical protein